MFFNVDYRSENLERLMANESSGTKCCLAISSSIHLCFAFIAGIILCCWWGNTHDIAEAKTGFGDFYDQLPAYYYNESETRYYGSNADDASEYYMDIEDDCGPYD